MKPNKITGANAGGPRPLPMQSAGSPASLSSDVGHHSHFMSYRTLFFVAALAGSLLAGCSRHPTPVTLTSSASIAIEPGVSIGPVHSGMKQQDVIAVLGEPSRKHDGVFEYHELGMALLPGKGGFFETVIFSGGSGPFQPFAGHTKEGIGIGSNRAEVIKAYGEPTTNEPARGVSEHSTLVYKTRGINFHIREDRVYKMAAFLKP